MRTLTNVSERERVGGRLRGWGGGLKKGGERVREGDRNGQEREREREKRSGGGVAEAVEFSSRPRWYHSLFDQ